MTRALRPIVACLLLLLAAACNRNALAPEADKTARAYLHAIDTNDAAAASAIAAAEIATPDVLAKAHAVAEPASDDLRFLSASWTEMLSGPNAGKRRTNLWYQRPHGDGWLGLEFVVDGSGDTARVVGFNLTPMAQSFEEQNRLTLAGKPPSSVLMLLIALTMLGITLWALIASFVTPPRRYRWLWRLFIIIGLTSFGTNWRTDVVTFTPLAFNLFSASLMRAGIGPWMLNWSIPVGAIWFLVRRHRLAQPKPESQES